MNEDIMMLKDISDRLIAETSLDFKRYIFPKIDTNKYNIHDDEKFALDFLREKKILFSHGGAFHWEKPDHL